MEMCGVYSVGKARIRWNKKDEYYEEYYEEKFRREGASTL